MVLKSAVCNLEKVIMARAYGILNVLNVLVRYEDMVYLFLILTNLINLIYMSFFDSPLWTFQYLDWLGICKILKNGKYDQKINKVENLMIHIKDCFIKNPIWSSLIKFDQVWSILIYFWQIWLNLIKKWMKLKIWWYISMIISSEI